MRFKNIFKVLCPPHTSFKVRMLALKPHCPQANEWAKSHDQRWVMEEVVMLWLKFFRGKEMLPCFKIFLYVDLKETDLASRYLGHTD